MPQSVSAKPAGTRKADRRERAVGLWRLQPRRSSDSRCDCAPCGRPHHFNHVVNHSTSRVSEVSQLGSKEVRGESLRCKAKEASVLVAHGNSDSDLFCEEATLPAYSEGNEHKCIEFLNLASQRALLLSSCKVILKWPVCCFFFPSSLGQQKREKQHI